MKGLEPDVETRHVVRVLLANVDFSTLLDTLSTTPSLLACAALPATCICSTTSEYNPPIASLAIVVPLSRSKCERFTAA